MSETTVRVDVALRVSPATAAIIKRLEDERNLTRTNLFLQALGLLHAAHDAAKDGQYIGLTKTRANLETLLVAPL